MVSNIKTSQQIDDASKERLDYYRLNIQRLQNVLLIWLDSNIDTTTEDYQNTIVELQRIINTVSTYTNSDQCIEFIKTIKDHKVCMILSGYLGQYLIPSVHNMSQVDSIFILCGNKKRHEEWTKKWPKIKDAQQCEQNAISMSFVRSVGILFVMTIDPKKSTTPFASIRDISAISDEDEVLFSMHSVFRIHDIKQMDGNNKLFEVNLTLTSDKDTELTALTERIREESVPDEEGWARLGLVLRKMGQNDKAEEIFKILLNQRMEESEKAAIYHQLAWITNDQAKYQEAINIRHLNHVI
ncbi:hypothetical protein I4U23_005645 [Adineta vaga]|nr:hypothetical protein I4U23_005645 [Adineta vaga]